MDKYLFFFLTLTLPLLAGFGLNAVLSLPVYAVTHIVTNANNSGAGSLRDTIAATNQGDTIEFDITLSEQTIIVTTELTIDHDLTIRGNVPITISGNNATRIIDVSAGHVTFDSLTIINGNAQPTAGCPAPSRCGGGILLQNSVALTITNSSLISNSAAIGGGIFVYQGKIRLDNANLVDNATTGGGGGIYVYEGAATVSNSLLSNNSASEGGGIKNIGSVVTITHSIMSNNFAEWGGGIANNNIMTITDNTILSGNSASRFGGGIANRGTIVVDKITWFLYVRVIEFV
jgi:large repetitive protein